jgi:hypothetical protein
MLDAERAHSSSAGLVVMNPDRVTGLRMIVE